jgi:Putative DNA-binding domain
LDAIQFEQLLYEEEGPTLDFKRDQYAFVKASDEDKLELLKDILGFVNCWRRSEALIVIGVQEVQGGRSIVHGVSEHLQDHTLQQFVNNLTNRSVQFCHRAFEFEGKQIGIIQIEQQQRPVYLKKDYGKLQKEKVYIRRGSSTDPSKPARIEEIALMGSANHPIPQYATLEVEFADVRREAPLGKRIEWSAELCVMPGPQDISNVRQRRSQIDHPLLGTICRPSLNTFESGHDRPNDRFYHEFAEYQFVRRLFREVRPVVKNTGEIPAMDVRIEMAVPTSNRPDSAAPKPQFKPRNRSNLSRVSQ